MSLETLPEASPLFGLAGEFASPDEILVAARRIGELGYTRAEAFVPFPIKGLSEVLVNKPASLKPIVLAGAVVGLAAGYALQWFVSDAQPSTFTGGRPLSGAFAFLPVALALAFLSATVSGLVAMLWMNRLPEPHHPMFRLERFSLARRDRFFLCIESTDPRFDLVRTRKMLEALGATSVTPVPA